MAFVARKAVYRDGDGSKRRRTSTRWVRSVFSFEIYLACTLSCTKEGVGVRFNEVFSADSADSRSLIP
jgi:hypothetical protein